jgi:salicylate hydroxylase
MPRWYRGRAVLIGDAVHSMMPHHGQGANTTFEDAVALAHAIADDSLTTLEDKLASYQGKRKPRAERIQQVSRATNDCLHLPPGPERDRRSVLLHRLPAQFSWMHEHGRVTVSAV